MTLYRVLKILFLSLGAVILAFAVAMSAFVYLPAVTDPYGVDYTVRAGSSLQSVENDLNARGVIKYPLLFRLLVYVKGSTHHLKAGEYLFPKGSTPLKILHQMTTGTGLVQHPFTIIAGWTFTQVRAALNREVLLQHDTQNLTPAEIMTRLGATNVNPEGQFYPDTYFYTSGNSDLTVLKRAYKKMQTALNQAWQNRAANLPYQTSYEALIAASLIEKEAHVNEERPIIAGVLINRLNSQMRLQFDPTVVYGLGDKFNGTIYKKDLTADTPYNTYVHKGLPPTPIAMPSIESINAVMHPMQHNYLYFVAQGNGRHQFTATLQLHHEAVTDARIKQANQPFFNKGLVKKYINQGAF